MGGSSKPGEPSRPREVVEDESFVLSRTQITADVSRWDEFWRAVEWVLAHDPTAFDRVDDLDLWVVVAEPSLRTGLPRVRIFYSFDDQRIRLRWAERA